jgi:hypothetical protein
VTRSRDRDDAPAVAPVLALGIVSVIGTAWFAWSLPASASRRSRPGAALAADVAPWRWAYEHLAPPASSGSLAVSLVVVAGFMFAAWAATIALTWRRSSPARVRVVVACAGLACLVGVTALPTHSSDIYDYALFGRVAARNGGAPYHDLPDAYPDDPMYRYSSHRYTGHPDNKLPAWTIVATAVARVSGDHPLVVLLAFRVGLAGATLASTVLIAHLLARLRPGSAAAGAAVYGLCPVTLVYGGAKTDALMVLAMLGGIALVARGSPYLATATSTLAVLVKAIAAPVLALVVLIPTGPPSPSRRRRWLETAGRIAVAALVAAAVYAPFRDPVGLARLHLGEADGTSVASLALPLALAGLAALLVFVVIRAGRRVPATAEDRARVLVEASAPLLVAFAVLLTRPGLPWYLLTPLAVLALARSLPLLVVLGSLAATSFMMGLWESVDTAQHPLPEVHASRPLVYLAIAVGALAVAAADVARRSPIPLRRGRDDGPGRGAGREDDAERPRDPGVAVGQPG